MKIVHALGWYYPESLGGTEVYVAGLCRRLVAAGYDVSIAAPDAQRTAAAEYVHEGIRVFRYPVPKTPTRDEAQGTVQARGAELFTRWLAAERADVLHVHSLVTGLGLHELRVAKDLGLRIVLTHHLPSLGYVCRTGTLMERSAWPCDGAASVHRCSACVLVSRAMPTLAARIVSRLPVSVSVPLGRLAGPVGTALGMPASLARDMGRRRDLGELVDYQVALNEVGRRILIANGVPADRVVLNRLGTDHEGSVRKPTVDEAPTRTPVRLGYLGRIDPSKGVRELLQAVVSLSPDAAFTLDIVGPEQSADRPYLGEELRQMAAGDSRVRFHAAIPSSEVPAMVAGWDVLCCPSTWFENGPTVALEAIAVGTPLVASRLGNLAEIVEEGVNGRLVPPGDVAALSNVLREVIVNPGATVDRWRRNLGPVRSLDEVARDYQTLYARFNLASVPVQRAEAMSGT